MKVTIDDETAKLLEIERAARGLRSATEANKEIIREAAEIRMFTATGERPARAAKKGRAK